MKGIKNTISACVILVLGIALTVALVFGKVDKETYAISLAALGVFGGVVNGLLSKDYDKSHSDPLKSANTNPDNPDGYPDGPS